MRESSKWLRKHALAKASSSTPQIFIHPPERKYENPSLREVFKKYYKACRLLFKENIPLGRPLKFSRPNSEVAVRRTVGWPLANTMVCDSMG
jgi:hypothetical protein